MTLLTPDVLIVGAGPAGLTAAAELAALGAGHVLVVEREEYAGGIPRHSAHTGYGLRDLRRVLSGPSYARHLVRRAEAAGAEIWTRAMVTGWAGTEAAHGMTDDAPGNAVPGISAGLGSVVPGIPAGLGSIVPTDPHPLTLTTPTGLHEIRPRAVVLATGARERPRAARRIPGDRPQGVYTTGQLQNLVHLHHRHIGERAVIVGAEQVSWSAALTLREAGCTPVLMTSERSRPESAFTTVGRTLLRVPVSARTRITRIIGELRCEAVELEHMDTGRRRVFGCDTVVLTGDWVPDHELARTAGLLLDENTLGPLTDMTLRTSRPGVFAAGNLLHPVDTADVAALDGRHVARHVMDHLRGGVTSAATGVRLVPDAPFRWITPGILRPDSPAPSRSHLLLSPERHVRFPRLTVRQDTRSVTHRPLPWPAAPGRVFRVPFSVLDGVDPAGGPVHLGIGHIE